MYLLYGHELTHVFNEHNLKKNLSSALCVYSADNNLLPLLRQRGTLGRAASPGLSVQLRASVKA